MGALWPGVPRLAAAIAAAPILLSGRAVWWPANAGPARTATTTPAATAMIRPRMLATLLGWRLLQVAVAPSSMLLANAGRPATAAPAATAIRPRLAPLAALQQRRLQPRSTGTPSPMLPATIVRSMGWPTAGAGAAPAAVLNRAPSVPLHPLRSLWNMRPCLRLGMKAAQRVLGRPMCAASAAFAAPDPAAFAAPDPGLPAPLRLLPHPIVP